MNKHDGSVSVAAWRHAASAATEEGMGRAGNQK